MKRLALLLMLLPLIGGCGYMIAETLTPRYEGPKTSQTAKVFFFNNSPRVLYAYTYDKAEDCSGLRGMWNQFYSLPAHKPSEFFVFDAGNPISFNLRIETQLGGAVDYCEATFTRQLEVAHSYAFELREAPKGCGLYVYDITQTTDTIQPESLLMPVWKRQKRVPMTSAGSFCVEEVG
ncbi:MAG TPA: hypothetical protein VM074_11050 [Solimonas sp.]|nr:hypothetical protein [Solimonas sp.]